MIYTVVIEDALEWNATNIYQRALIFTVETKAFLMMII